MIFLDLDGVIAEFMYAACDVHDKPHDWPKYNHYESWGMTRDEFWRPINMMGTGFYMDVVKPAPWAERLIATCRKADPELVVLTDSTDNMPGVYGKHLWIERMFGVGTKVSYTREKHLLAAPGRLLIDDNPQNCEAFAMFGGSALLFPRPWNAGYPNCQGSYMTVIHKVAKWKHLRTVSNIATADILESIETCPSLPKTLASV